MWRLGDPKQGAGLLVNVEPAPGEPQQLVAGRVAAETINTTVGGMQPPVEPAC